MASRHLQGIPLATGFAEGSAWVMLPIVTDTIPLSEAARKCSRIRQHSVAQILAETIRRMTEGESVSSLYVD